MSDESSVLVGKSGKAEIIEIYAAVGNKDLNGSIYDDRVDRAYFLMEAEAIIGARGIGVLGSNGEVEKRYAIKLEDGSVYLLASSDAATPTKDAPLIKISSVKICY